MEKHLDYGKPAGVFAWYGDHIRHPSQVTRDPFLTIAQKREFLADWASDRHAVRDDPDLRVSSTGALASIEDILDALKALDGASERPTRPRRLRDILPLRSKLLLGEGIRVRRGRHRDDDDDDRTPDGSVDLWVETFKGDESGKLRQEHEGYWQKEKVEFNGNGEKSSHASGEINIQTVNYPKATWKGDPTVLRYLSIGPFGSDKKMVLVTYWASPGGDKSSVRRFRE